MRFISRTWQSSFVFFVLLLAYFVWSYRYYPGLELRISGEIEAHTSAKVFWDYGYGFNDLDSIDLQLSATGDLQESALGKITISPAGFKSEESRGYLAWLVIPERMYTSAEFTLVGKHHWGTWVAVNKDEKGRQLALYPGTTFTIATNSNFYRLLIFRAPQAGYIKVQSDKGPERFYDGYAINKKWDITAVIYSSEPAGKIQFHIDPFRNKNNPALQLPRQKVAAVQIDLSPERVKTITPYREIEIRLSRKDSAFSESQVYLQSIAVNGEKLTSDDPRIIGSTAKKDGDGFILSDTESAIRITGEISSYELVLERKSFIAELDMYHDGKPATLTKIYPSGDSWRVGNTAPVEWFRTKIDSCEILDKKGRVFSLSPERTTGGTHLTADLRQIPQSAFSLLLFSFQLLLAAGITLIVRWITLRIAEARGVSSSSLLRYVFVDERRWFFWLVVFFGATINFLYLAADWPGSMTPDSVFMHTELKRLQFTNHHPYSYSLILLALHMLYDAPVVVVIFQILAFHTLCGLFFYMLYRHGVSLYILVVLYVLVPLSIPVNLLNITIWKDIPYSLVVLFWAFFLSYLLYNRLYGDDVELPGRFFTVVLAFAFMLLCTLRHNGIVYLPFIPFVLLYLCRVRFGWWVRFCTFSAAFLLLYYYVLPPLVLFEKPQLNNYAKQETTKYLGEMASVTTGDEQGYLENYLAERTRKFVATLGTSSKASTWYNDMHAPPQRWFSVDEARGEMATAPLSSTLAVVLQKILQTREYTGLFSGRFVYWNSLFALLGLIGAGLLYKWLPLSAFYSVFFLYQAFFMYFVVWERWRYLYFIYLGGLFLLPIIALEISKRKNVPVFR
jgi:hypothetical protein